MRLGGEIDSLDVFHDVFGALLVDLVDKGGRGTGYNQQDLLRFSHLEIGTDKYCKRMGPWLLIGQVGFSAFH